MHHQLICRLCGTPQQAGNWGGTECLNCRSVCVNVLPSPEELARFYAGYVNTYRGGGGSDGANLERYARRYLEIVRRHVRIGRLLDVGSSNNPFPNLASRAGFEVEVMDYVRPAGLETDIRFTPGHLDSKLVAEKFHTPFDVVTCWAVLEHVSDPLDAIRALGSLVRPGGWCVLMIPEQGTALTHHALGRSPWFYPPEHLHLCSPQVIAQAFQAERVLVQAQGRLELNLLRFAARYGVGVAEALVGISAGRLFPRLASRLRARRVHRFKGMVYMVLRRDLESSDGI